MPSNTHPKLRVSSMSVERKENSEVRKLRNRISQKVFRAKKAMRMKDLEERLRGDSLPDKEWITQLQDRNASLRDQLLECHKKFTSLQVSIKSITDATALVLGIESIDSHGSDQSGNEILCPRCKRSRSIECEAAVHAIPSLESDIGQSDTCTSGDDDGGSNEQQTALWTGIDADLITDINIVGAYDGQYEPVVPVGDDSSHHLFATQDPIQEFQPKDRSFMPNSHFTLDGGLQNGDPLMPTGASDGTGVRLSSLGHHLSQSLGPDTYAAIKNMAPFMDRLSGLRRTNSALSDHIDALEYCLSVKASHLGFRGTKDEMIATSIQSMLLAFISISWSTMISWHKYTLAHVPLNALMAWRLNKCPDSYMAIIPAYRPTKLQMAVPHPSMIDWIPWPSLRDKLIVHHSANPGLDELICEIGNSYVVPTDLSILVRLPQPIVGYVSVWDLVRAVASETSPSAKTATFDHSSIWALPGSLASCWNFVNNETLSATTDSSRVDPQSLPVPDADTLFSSRDLALQAFRILGMDNGAFTFSLDPTFFQRHPELYDSRSNLMAQGMALRPTQRTPVVTCRPLDPSVLGQYEEMSRHLAAVPAMDSLDMDARTLYTITSNNSAHGQVL